MPTVGTERLDSQAKTASRVVLAAEVVTAVRECLECMAVMAGTAATVALGYRVAEAVPEAKAV